MDLNATLLDLYGIPETQHVVKGADRSGKMEFIPSNSVLERQAGIFCSDVCQIEDGW